MMCYSFLDTGVNTKLISSEFSSKHHRCDAHLQSTIGLAKDSHFGLWSSSKVNGKVVARPSTSPRTFVWFHSAGDKTHLRPRSERQVERVAVGVMGRRTKHVRANGLYLVK